MVEVPWGELASKPKASESLIGMLVLRLRPQAFPVDGSGGDGGRDLFEYTERRELINYEAKSFTGRMTRGRRNQVRDSLLSTARHQPDYWDLLVPIDANPAELKWFDGLREEFPFVRNWRGLTWLNSHFAAHQDLVRYSWHSSTEILKQIGEARAERDMLLRGVPDFAERHAMLVRRAQEVSPFYSLRATTDPDGESIVEIVPKCLYIPEEELVTLTGHVAFRKDDPEHVSLQLKFERVIRFGGDEIQLAEEHLREFIVTAPAGLGISGTALPSMLRISAKREPVDPPVKATIAVRSENGRTNALLQAIFTQRSAGAGGGCLYGADLADSFKIRYRADTLTGQAQFKMTFLPPEQAMPSAYVPALRLMSQMLPGRFLELILPDYGGTQLSEPVQEERWPLPPDEARRWADAFDDLARLQSLTGHFFPVPDGFTLRDTRDVREALALLEGEKIQVQGGTVSVQVVGRAALDHFSGTGQSRLAAIHQGVAYEFGDNRIDLGPMVQVVVIDLADDLEEERRRFDEEGRVTVRLKIAEGASLVRYLGSELPA
ncbi:hypothetical protein [Actinacidiphila sp. bgisy145]|uniref:hypothetical protein n=1 Tax=Actinacidiphila sp. bgisy145 TaxID=3413792 RepID=UPI003EBDD028